MALFTPESTWEEFKTLDRDGLMERLAGDLPLLSGEIGTTPKGLAARTGLDTDRFGLIASGKRKKVWSEYMSILFVLWDNEKGRALIEEKGYFPEPLKSTMYIVKRRHISLPRAAFARCAYRRRA